MPSYYSALGGHPDQLTLTSDRARFTECYAVIPRRTMRDIVTSFFPGWTGARGWVLARPLTGFAETFSQTIMELVPGGGSDHPEPDAGAQCVLFIVAGEVTVTLDGQLHQLGTGGYAYLPAGSNWQIVNSGSEKALFHWVRKAYQAVPGLDAPDAFFTSDAAVTPVEMPGTNGAWATSRFADPSDLRHDMHVNIVTFQPGGAIPFAETHVMEHGLYILQGKGVYLLNQDWIEVEAGDFLWLRAFCPQACYAGGPEPFRYLLYKDVNRHPALRLTQR